ncbi:protein translocase subunit SecD [Patescibacteria group bacterium]
MKKNLRRFWWILILILITIYINLPESIYSKINLPSASSLFSRDLTLKKGLDIQGGTYLSLEADMQALAMDDRADALESSKQIIARRVDLYGVSEPVIQTSQVNDSYRIIVELPGIQDIDKTIKLIGQTAQLDFRQDIAPDAHQVDYASPSAIARVFQFQPTGLTGKDLKKASVVFNQQNQTASQPVVSLEFTSEGVQKFSDITANNVGLPVAIFLDNQLVTAPIVNEAITSGQAIISGGFTPETASDLAIQLNAGALPVPIKIIEQKNISATLGEESVNQSITAGILGLGLVMLFMILYYGLNGLIASLALIIYGLITLSVYKLVPVTLTLPGIAGFILSVGMAVDSNILIFERLKEELRDDRPFAVALELGFGRAWDSIKDANLATIITSLVLINPLNWNFLNTSGLVRGFAITLLIGVIVSLFTGVVVTRTFMRLIYSKRTK